MLMKKAMALSLSFLFLLTSLSSPFLYAYPVASATHMSVERPLLKGIRLAENGKLAFVWEGEDITREAGQPYKDILSYFYTALAIPKQNWWVDLFVLNTEDNVMGAGLEDSRLGYVLLNADLEMKRVINRLMDPSSPTGEALWSRLEDMGISHFMPRFWIVPGKMRLYTNENSAYLDSAELDIRVALEGRTPQEEKEKIMAALEATVVPELKRIINTSDAFSELRQAYYAMVLAQWVKMSVDEQVSNTRLASLVDSFITPDVGLGRVDRYGYLKEFSKEYLFSELESDLGISVRGGGEDFSKVDEVIGEDSQVDKDPVSRAKDPVVSETDVPFVDEANNIYERNLAQDFGLDPNSVRIFGKLKFEGVEPAKVMGQNLLVVNQSKDALVIDKEFVEQYADRDNMWTGGKISNALIVKDKDGKLEVFYLAGKRVEGRDEAVKFLDTVGKMYALRERFSKYFPGAILEVLISQRLGEVVTEEDQELLRQFWGGDGLHFNWNRMKVSSTAVREGRQKHFLPYPVLRLLEDGYYSPWNAIEELNEDQIAAAENIKKIIESIMKADDTVEEANNLLKEKERWGDPSYWGLLDEKNPVVRNLKRLNEIFSTGKVLIDGKEVELKGDAFHIIDLFLFTIMENNYIRPEDKSKLPVQEQGQKDAKYMLARAINNLMLEKLVTPYIDRTAFADYEDLYEAIKKTADPMEKVSIGEKAYMRMVRDTRKAVFGDKDLTYFKTQAGNSGVEEEVIARIEQENDLLALQKGRKALLKAYEGEKKKTLEALIDFKESLLIEKVGNDLYENFKERIRKGELDVTNPEKAIFYWPMKGNPPHEGHITSMLGILVDLNLDMGAVSADATDPRKKSLSAAAVRRHLKKKLVDLLSGGLVVFSEYPFKDPITGKQTGEESIVPLLKESGMDFGLVVYCAGSDHGKVFKVPQDVADRINNALETLKIPYRVKPSVGLFVESRPTPVYGPKKADKSEAVQDFVERALAVDSIDDRLAIEDKGTVESLIQALREEFEDAGLDDVLSRINSMFEEGLLSWRDVLSFPPISALLGDVAGGKYNLPKETTDKLKKLLAELNNSADRTASNPSANVKKNVGGLLLSQISFNFN